MRKHLLFMTVLIVAILFPLVLSGQSFNVNRVQNFVQKSVAQPGASNVLSQKDQVMFQIGGTISKNLSLYGEAGNSLMSEPDVTWQNRSAQLENADFSVTDIGVGISYYFMPSNIYLSTTLTMSKNKIKADEIEEAETEAGLGIYLSAGKEWWVSNRWGLGFAIFGNFSQSRDKGNGVEYNVTNRVFAVLFSATFD
ncbi:MAG: hypothetical protein P8184_18175 [Calditrichia bacterium]